MQNQDQERDEQGQFTDEERSESENSDSGEGSEGGESGGTSKRGFASMSEEQRKKIASKGGQSQGKDVNPGNFANDREKASAAGRKGGQA
jgi:general stress protein YciG